jgi:2,4-dienoyl-CoA reductase-like NADH-dependent reductase (Old Yellow Enzyme family)
MTDLDPVFAPLRIGHTEARNRILLSSHATVHEPDRYAGYLAARARGGAGTIVLGGNPVHPSSPQGWIDNYDPASIPVYRGLADAVHEHGTLLFSQLWHRGLQGSPDQSFAQTGDVFAPSTGMTSPTWGQFGHAMRHEEIAEVVEGFARSAEVSRAGGLDGCEVHAGHGYLLWGFLSPLTNKRTDEYGGSPENRARFAVEVIEAIRRRVGDDFVVGMKFALDERVGDLGMTPADAQASLRYIAEQTNLDYVSLSAAGYHSLESMVVPAQSDLSGHMVEQGPLVREAAPDVVVMATCAIRTVQQAADILATGKVDVVGMVRPQIADPEIVSKTRAGRTAEVRPCVGANQGCWRRLQRGGQVTCTVNPEAGRERQWAHHFDRVDNPGHVLVVGGGPAGLSAAESAARRGHRVTLVERGTELGGQLRTAGMLPGRDSWHRYVAHMAGSLDRLGVDVRLGVDATVETARELGADLVVVATGSAYVTDGFSMFRPSRTTIPGLDTTTVLEPEAAIDGSGAVGKKTIIVDDHGQHLAMGMAELLAQRGVEVELVTLHGHIGHNATTAGTVDLPVMYPRLVAAGVRCSSETVLDRIEGSTVHLAHSVGAWTRTEHDVDSVILVQSRHARSGLYDALVDAGIPAEVIGDAHAPREVDEATYEGAVSALDVPVRAPSLAAGS